MPQLFDNFGKRIIRNANDYFSRGQRPPQSEGLYRVGKAVFKPNRMVNQGDWRAIEGYLKTCEDIRYNICFKCGASAGNIFDKNNIGYKISRGMTLQEVKDLVEEIRKINAIP